ncbi:hypothetical protein PQX77_013532 [Marasmius sp. AFHP31]|nr:hypothetical protein PQX77_013532 [Marasmius sp. AFHP31]
MAGNVLKLVKEYKYVGILFTSVQRDIFERCYSEKARKARASACGIFGTDRLVGRRRLPPTITRNLYTALVDRHLIFGSEVIVDVGTKGPNELDVVQKNFLRRMLGLSKKSTLAGLYTETALLPLQFRRIILTLGYLAYLLKRVRDEGDEGLEPSYTSLALRASSRLREADSLCWLMDIDWVLQNLPGSEGKLKLPPLETMTVDLVTDLRNRTSTLACQQLQGQIDTNSKLTLLRDRIEPVDPSTKDSPRRHILYVRHYLKQVPDHRHRVILTRLVLGDLSPAVFRARAGKEYTQTDNWRSLMCRGCGLQYETPEHVVFRCMGDVELGRTRLLLVRDIAKRWCDWRIYQTAPLELMKRCIFDWDFVGRFARALFAIVARWRERVKNPIKVFDDDMTDGDSEEEWSADDSDD